MMPPDFLTSSKNPQALTQSLKTNSICRTPDLVNEVVVMIEVVAGLWWWVVVMMEVAGG
ncbi:hypothetical protein HanRHA438_Chr12g0555461 [Helianthus annuus]|uniref:Uncharacterized protein n=1 Tax=Helianthus annuus TaxID=4232 RepID=A0A251T2D3_HELAN|nr:hypothetical protein HanHA300_Chr12g0445751 [Helianthus annuus]KAJ0493479.1 hypothetical protein HanIR_Chr12g0586591 [Helianthus annuus]KAJ0505501.1 hypothetical protein HanHA89_Chr12g0471251 [Helianthus annuus]KAJ0675168.1 hypothetical protein HanLR1_Chr12g0448151 [Helianthus annuus]KAJ0866764.1 hypothetical protein HanRHA438_Chr12g0555461 [Helianthus annuus]